MDKQAKQTSVQEQQENCEQALACRIVDLIDEAAEEGFTVPEAVQAIVKISHSVYMREGSVRRKTGPKNNQPRNRYSQTDYSEPGDA
ncbi:hypothetical protein ACRS7F_24025 [Brucella anthropi]|jgi:hypothetical protein|uniref:hypothetical protein n=1 Tax=Brucella anthropi TaxID=529 RepID=UPI0017470D60|nr:hypothetical protein HGK82_23190 [Ochrobactrum sp. MT180101]